MTSLDVRLIDRAITLCEQNPPIKNKQRIAAIVTDGRGNILSTGLNSYTKTHPFQAHYADKTNHKEHIYLHAEIAALIRNKSDGAAKIYVARIYRDGSLAYAKPCPICSMAIKDAGIEEVIFTGKEKIEKRRMIK